MVFRGENMLITNNMLKNSLKDYSNINNKICREVKDKKLYRIVNGLYDTNGDTSAYLLASSIYGPSYISFEYALSYYGLIPERVNAVTCATFNKKKRKIYNNHFGSFSYEDVPSRAFPYEIILKQEGNYSFIMATAEKALCDKLYSLKPLNNLKNMQIMLFDDLRIDEEEFYNLDVSKIEKLSELYHSTNVSLLAKFLRRNKNE